MYYFPKIKHKACILTYQKNLKAIEETAIAKIKSLFSSLQAQPTQLMRDALKFSEFISEEKSGNRFSIFFLFI